MRARKKASVQSDDLSRFFSENGEGEVLRCLGAFCLSPLVRDSRCPSQHQERVTTLQKTDFCIKRAAKSSSLCGHIAHVVQSISRRSCIVVDGPNRAAVNSPTVTACLLVSSRSKHAAVICGSTSALLDKDKEEVTEYFNNNGFERWNKIYSESDEVNNVQMDIRTGHGQTIDKVISPPVHAPDVSLSLLSTAS